ncbi:uncharacterized protein LOC133659634 [Entelurus aequoreus]|uniref:uncharacterized protein LOC133659634 n=1 Tax=Entelurus aequoreus TaxID=161455 RepID=UPI002B1CF225|nr:uncharacterized protein LOC133659634 [Entelurus aequoreus]
MGSSPRRRASSPLSCLFHSWKLDPKEVLYHGNRRVIRTEEEKVAVLTEAHAGHFGPRRMQAKIAPWFYWRSITQDTLDWCHCFTDHTYAGPTSPWKKELHPDQKQLLQYVLACDRPATELIVKEGGACLTREEFWSLGLSRDMESTIGNACLQLVQEAAQRHGKDVFIANMYIVPTWKHKDVDPMSSLPRDAHLKDALLFPAWSKHNGPEHYLLCVSVEKKNTGDIL